MPLPLLATFPDSTASRELRARWSVLDVACALVTLLLSSCATTLPSSPVHMSGAALRVPGLVSCEAESDREVTLDPERPLVVLVPGCSAPKEAFETLSEIFSLHGQQTVCFRYDDRARVRTSGEALRRALDGVVKRLTHPEVVVLGHSQGGLVARAALTARADLSLTYGRYRLVTVSSPFGGVHSATSCGSWPLRLASFGMTAAICRAITGANWREIHPQASAVRAPAPLSPAVREHLTVITDERDSCRRYTADGKHCVQDDYVFSIAEQLNPRIEQDQRVRRTWISAGHSQVIGALGDTPRKLLKTLDARGVLQPVPDSLVGLERLSAHLGW